jgi:predicted enzyme related to lactoylglutathione lyase
MLHRHGYCFGDGADSLEEIMNRLVTWFDIPVADMQRAIAFYEKVTEQKLKRLPVGPDKETALFASDG